MSAASEATDLVLVERHEGVLTITINRPAQKNAVKEDEKAKKAKAAKGAKKVEVAKAAKPKPAKPAKAAK